MFYPNFCVVDFIVEQLSISVYFQKLSMPWFPQIHKLSRKGPVGTLLIHRGYWRSFISIIISRSNRSLVWLFITNTSYLILSCDSWRSKNLMLSLCMFILLMWTHLELITNQHTSSVFWKVLLLLIFYNPLFMVMSLFTFSAPLCKCHYSMLSDDNNNNKKQNNKKERFEEWESIQHFCQGAERDSHFASRIDLSSLPLVKKKKVNKRRLKAGLSVKWIRVELSVRPSVWL